MSLSVHEQQKRIKIMNIEAIKTHIGTLSADTRADIAFNRWDELMTDRLYSACGAETVEEMRSARESAVNLCKGGAR